MAVHFTVPERQCIMACWRIAQQPNFNETVKAEKGWLVKHEAVLKGAINKLLAPEALEEATVVEKIVEKVVEKAPAPSPAPKTKKKGGKIATTE